MLDPYSSVMIGSILRLHSGTVEVYSKAQGGILFESHQLHTKDNPWTTKVRVPFLYSELWLYGSQKVRPCRSATMAAD